MGKVVSGIIGKTGRDVVLCILSEIVHTMVC